MNFFVIVDIYKYRICYTSGEMCQIQYGSLVNLPNEILIYRRHLREPLPVEM